MVVLRIRHASYFKHHRFYDTKVLTSEIIHRFGSFFFSFFAEVGEAMQRVVGVTKKWSGMQMQHCILR